MDRSSTNQMISSLGNLNSFRVVKKIGESIYSIFLINKNVDNSLYALKVYPHKAGKPCNGFKSESRLCFLHHPNVISLFDAIPEKNELNSNTKISYIIMEYAKYGDFGAAVMHPAFPREEKLVRTFFRQIIEGLTYLHANGVRHLDMKIENLLLDGNFNLKIADFDTSFLEGDSRVASRGTEGFRPPEMINLTMSNLSAADIYSTGITLFVMMTGNLAYSEAGPVENVDLFNLFMRQDEKFWEIHAEIANCPQIKFKNMRSLIYRMTNRDPTQRLTLEQIKKDPWYLGPVYSQSELKKIMDKVVSK